MTINVELTRPMLSTVDDSLLVRLMTVSVRCLPRSLSLMGAEPSQPTGTAMLLLLLRGNDDVDDNDAPDELSVNSSVLSSSLSFFRRPSP